MRPQLDQPSSYLNEEAADAFFHEGDAGTYDGGPALSLMPVGMSDLVEDAGGERRPSPEQLARRERMKRLVTTVVSTLAAGSALVFALRITRSESANAKAAPMAATAVTVPTGIAAPTPVAVAAVAPVHAAPSETTTPAVAAVPVPAVPVPSEPFPTAPVLVARAAVRHRAPQIARSQNRNGQFIAPPSQTAIHVPPAGRHSPPTANFPD